MNAGCVVAFWEWSCVVIVVGGADAAVKIAQRRKLASNHPFSLN